MKTNSDEAIRLMAFLTRPPSGLPSEMERAFTQLAGMVKAIDKENLRLRQEVQMLRAVLEQERDKVC